MNKDDLKRLFAEGRKIERVDYGRPSSRPDASKIVELLSGTWHSHDQGWNLIALPMSTPNKFRLLMNQYGEMLKFNVADKKVPNRGVTPDTGEHAPDPVETDQLIDAVAYEQTIVQKAVADFPASTKREINGNPIHHEPGFFMHLRNHISVGKTEEDKLELDENGNTIIKHETGDPKSLQIARLATIPHGNSVLAMGTVEYDLVVAPDIQIEDARPERLRNPDPETNEYLEPYKHFQDSPFFGNVAPGTNGFPGFSPDDANKILRAARSALKIKSTTVLSFDTKYQNDHLTGVPISNIPFVKREADVTEVHANFWIMELEKPNADAPSEFVMQYSQTVYLEFFDTDFKDENGELIKGKDGKPLRIRWPHVSINTLRKIVP